MAEKEHIERDMYYQKINGLSKGGCGDYPLYCLAINDCMNVLNEMPAADVAPVRHGCWVKEKSDVLTDTDKWIEQITNLVVDVNPAEITLQAQERNLKEWCLNWQREMNMLIITAPLDYSNSKES